VRPRTVRQAHAVADLCDELSGFFTRLHRPESAVWLVDKADALRTATDASEVRDRCRRVRSVLSQGWGGPGDLTVTTTEGAVDGPADDRYRALLHEACARAAPYPDWLRWVVPYAVVAIAVVAAAIFHIVALDTARGGSARFPRGRAPTDGLRVLARLPTAATAAGRPGFRPARVVVPLWSRPAQWGAPTSCSSRHGGDRGSSGVVPRS
jgi:hypothetical protein